MQDSQRGTAGNEKTKKAVLPNPAAAEKVRRALNRLFDDLNQAPPKSAVSDAQPERKRSRNQERRKPRPVPDAAADAMPEAEGRAEVLPARAESSVPIDSREGDRGRGGRGLRARAEGGGREGARGRGRGGRGGGAQRDSDGDQPEGAAGRGGSTQGRRPRGGKPESVDGAEEAPKAVPKILLRKAEPPSK